MMPRVSGVWKSNGHRGLPNHGTTTSFLKHQRHESHIASYWHWKKPFSLLVATSMFLFLLVLCLFVLPAPSMDISENAEVGLQALLKEGLQGLPLQQASNALRAEKEEVHLERKSTEWHPKPDHFTLFNLSSATPSNPLNLTNGIRIYVYDLPTKFNDDWLVDERCSNQLFASEVAIHKILMNSPIRTFNPYDADFFFMPVYVSCKFSSKTGFPWLGHAPTLMEAAVNHVSTEMEFWNRSGGRDHVFVAAHDYGACFHSLETEAIAHGIPVFMQNSIILQTFGVEGFHPCQIAEHIQIPPYISPSKALSYVTEPPEQQRRNIFAYFRGKMEINPKNVSGLIYSRGIRTVLYKRFSRNRRFFLKRHRAENYQLEMLRSTFCLCPLGWAPWSPRIVESVTFGCVPVIIADNIALPYSHVVDWSAISLTVREHDVPKLYKILLNVAATNLTTIQKNLWKDENRRALLFTDPLVQGDATWHIFDRLSTRLERSHVMR
ncbi:hypothetical protein M758_1G135500 [Ceratodon purpureus]|nr:hypothetical protein M758_1G135500 [Ceratodon purpureus]